MLLDGAASSRAGSVRSTYSAWLTVRSVSRRAHLMAQGFRFGLRGADKRKAYNAPPTYLLPSNDTA